MGELALEVAQRRSVRFLFAMGGDTAARIVASLGVDYIDFTDEILPGLPYGLCRSRALGMDLDFACKSGGFGAMDALVQVLDGVTGIPSHGKAAPEDCPPASGKEKSS